MVSVTTPLPTSSHFAADTTIVPDPITTIVPNPIPSRIHDSVVPAGVFDTSGLWAAVFAVLPIPAVLVSASGFIIASNRASEEISELSSTTLIGYPWRWLVELSETSTGDPLPRLAEGRWIGTLHAASGERQVIVQTRSLAPALDSTEGPAPILYLIETIKSEVIEKTHIVEEPLADSVTHAVPSGKVPIHKNKTHGEAVVHKDDLPEKWPFTSAYHEIAGQIIHVAPERHAPHLLDVAHEMRSPLQSFSLAISELIDDNLALSPDNQRHLFNVLGRSAIHLQTLIENLLDAASIGANSFSVAPRATDLAEVIEEAILVVGPLLRPQGQTISVQLPPESLIVQADPQRIRQVLVNLLVNAIKYGPAHEAITIQVRYSTATTVVEVVDRGPGIPEAEHAHLFDRYFRGSATRGQMNGIALARPGVGLGLAICKAIILAHGGTIGVRSIPGYGATLWFTLRGRTACVS